MLRAARAVGIHRATAYRWAKDTAVRAELARIDARYQQARAFLAAARKKRPG